MSINKMASTRSLAAVYKRVSNVTLSLPAPETQILPYIKFIEQDVIDTPERTSYADTDSKLISPLEPWSDVEYTLYDTTPLDELSDAAFGQEAIDDLVSGNGTKAVDMPVKGKFTHRDLADILFSLYVHLVDVRNNPPEPEPMPEPEPAPETATETEGEA